MNALETLVLRYIGENVSNPDVFSDITPIRDSINDAVQELQALTGGVTDQFVIPLVEDKTFYRLSFQHGHFGWIQDAWLVNNKRRLGQTDRYRLDYLDPRWMKSTGTPESYFQVGLDVIGVYPKPSASSDVVELKCVVIPSRYEDDIDRVKLRETYKWAVVHYAVSEYYASRGAAKEARHHMAQYMQALGLKNNYFIAPERHWRLESEKDPWPTETQRRPF